MSKIKRGIILILWLLILIVFVNGESTQQSEAEKYFNEAFEYFKQGEYEKVITSCKRATEIYSNYLDAYFAMGRAYTLLGKYKEAISIFEESLSIDPNDVDIYLGLGAAYIGMNEYQKGISVLKKVLEIKSDSAAAYVALAGIYEELKLYQECFSMLEKAKDIAPDYGDVYAGLGDYYRKLKQTEKAKENYKKAISIYRNQDLEGLAREYEKRLNKIDKSYVKIYLKSGGIVKGQIIEETDTYLKVEGDVYSKVAGGFIMGLGGENKYNKTDIERIEKIE